MSFIGQLLNPVKKNDLFGIDSAVDGIQLLKKRLSDENLKLQVEQEKIRDAVLDDPGGDIDEMPICRQQERIKVFESALEEAFAKAAAKIQARMPEIKAKISDLEGKQDGVRRKLEEENLLAIVAFVKSTGARVVEMPRRGRAGIIQVAGVKALTNDEAAEILKDLPAPGHKQPTEKSKEFDAIADQLRRLNALDYLGARRGLEALVG